MNYPLFYQNETFMMTVNGLQYTRYFMSKFIGKATTDALHDYSGALQALNISQIEHSLIIPIVLCRADPHFIEPDTVNTIKQCYMYALYIQLSTTRTEDEAKIFFDQILQVGSQVLGEMDSSCLCVFLRFLDDRTDRDFARVVQKKYWRSRTR